MITGQRPTKASNDCFHCLSFLPYINKVVFSHLCLSVCLFKGGRVPSDQYQWCIGLHHTETPGHVQTLVQLGPHFTGHDLVHPSGISLALPPDMFKLVHYEVSMADKRIYVWNYLNHSELSLMENVSGSEPQPGTMLENTDGLKCHQITDRPMPMANYWATLTTTFYKVSFLCNIWNAFSVRNICPFVNYWEKPIAERTFDPICFTKWLNTQIRHWYCKYVLKSFRTIPSGKCLSTYVDRGRLHDNHCLIA